VCGGPEALFLALSAVAHRHHDGLQLSDRAHFTTSYTYDAASNRTGFTDPESGSTSYSYDTLNRLTTIWPPSAITTGSFGFSHDVLSRRTQMIRPNNVTTDYTYNSLSNLTSVLHKLSGSTIDGASYTVDSVGNRTAKVDQLARVRAVLAACGEPNHIELHL
jgi:YD repeat-containing protein